MNVPVQLSELHKHVPILDAVISYSNTASVSAQPHTCLVCFVLCFSAQLSSQYH